MASNEAPSIDRLSIRQRPSGSPLMFQSWNNLLFMHWPVEKEMMRSQIPDSLSVDTYEGKAWIGITPFTARNTRARFTPSVPYVTSFHELNVRTYVHVDGVPGIYFFSLDANSIAGVLGARTFFHLPYYWARIRSDMQGDAIVYTANRRSSDTPASFRAVWSIGERLPQPKPSTFPFFLVERYCLYTTFEERLYRARIHHKPWPLRAAELSTHHTTYLQAADILPDETDPVVHYSDGVRAEIWPLRDISDRRTAE